MNTKRVQLAEAQLQNNPTNEEVRGILSDSQAKLAEIFQNQVARNQHLSSSNWFRYGDTCSKTFFDFHRAGQKKTPMRELVTDNGPIRRQTDLTNHITDFYTKLYTSEAHLPGTQEAQASCWDSVPARVSAETNSSLTQSLTLEEVVKAILALPKNKAPGQDRIPIEFFQSCVNEVAPSLLMAYTAMLNSGEASTFINRGLITLIPKTGDRSKLGNWRPITLLGCIYKILAKALAGRLQTFLPSIIRPNQTGFVEGRSILDNVFMAQDSLSWAEESNQDLVLLLLDFEKAFDRIEWNFLFSAMDHIGFSNTWIKWVRTLYREASSAIKVNGVVGPTFQLARSVRQGCPLAPYLFIIATDILGYMLADPRHGIEGLTLPKGGRIRDQTFADDTALYLKGDEGNLDRAKGVLEVFCKASGARINWNKSSAIWASRRERTWDWGQEVGLKWVPKGEGVKYLGVQVGFHLPTEANFNKMLSALKEKLICWSHSNLSLVGRVLVANQVLLASTWYLAACWNPNPSMCSQVRGVIRNFIWGGGKPRSPGPR